MMKRKIETICPILEIQLLPEKILSLKVVDSCWISSTEWSNTFRSFFVYGKKQESRKKYIS